MALGANLWAPPSEEVAQEYYRLTEKFPEELLLSLYREVKHDSVLTSKNLALEISKKIIDAVNSKASFSMVRMGDGEGCCLLNETGFEKLRGYILGRISYIHFGDQNVILENQNEFLSMMEASIKSADVICVPEHQVISAGFHKNKADLDVRAVIGNRISALSVANLIQPWQMTSSAWVHRNLLPYYSSILKNQKRVGVISSHPQIGELIRKEFNVAEIVYHAIPKQAVFLKESDRTNSYHYPKVFSETIQAIDPTPGMPYLVSAGLLAKYYCHVIKERGGVALDTGTVPEIWLGIPNRGLSEEFINRWKLV